MSAPVILALSPHLDDAAFSCGATLARHARAGHRTVVATLFTASVPEPEGFALACQLDKGLGPEVDYMALRRDEDTDACRALGAEPLWLPFREAPHRGYGSAAELFAGTREDDDVVPDLADAIGSLVSRFRPALVLAPQAVGGHVDHVQTARAIFAAALEAPVAWWRDYPYDSRGSRPAEPFRDRFEAEPAQAVEPHAAELGRKREACLAYRSQVGFQFGGAAGLAAMLGRDGGVERFRGADPR